MTVRGRPLADIASGEGTNLIFARDPRVALLMGPGLCNRERLTMCDYSLQNVKSRPAQVGDKLMTRNFGTGTGGFAAPEDLTTAVCLMPGTELAFSNPVVISNWLPLRTMDHKTAIFRQVARDITVKVITTPWNSRTVKPFCLRIWRSISTRPCCSCLCDRRRRRKPKRRNVWRTLARARRRLSVDKGDLARAGATHLPARMA